MLRSAGILARAHRRRGAAEIARRARGTPRVANRLLRRVRDFAEVRHDGAVTRRHRARRAWSCSRWTRRASTGSTTPILRADRREVRRRARSGSRPWPPRSGRRPTRSRTSSSPTCCSSGSCSGRRGAGWPPSAPTATWALSVPGHPAAVAPAGSRPGPVDSCSCFPRGGLPCSCSLAATTTQPRESARRRSCR